MPEIPAGELHPLGIRLEDPSDPPWNGYLTAVEDIH